MQIVLAMLAAFNIASMAKDLKSDKMCKQAKRELRVIEKFIADTEPVIIEYEDRLKKGQIKIREHKEFCQKNPKNKVDCYPSANLELKEFWHTMNEHHKKMNLDVKKANADKLKWKKALEDCPAQ